MVTASKPTFIECDHCKSPALLVRGDHIVVRQRHHGRSHDTWIAIRELLEKIDVG